MKIIYIAICCDDRGETIRYGVSALIVQEAVDKVRETLERDKKSMSEVIHVVRYEYEWH